MIRSRSSHISDKMLTINDCDCCGLSANLTPWRGFKESPSPALSRVSVSVRLRKAVYF
jgi:hypothetical protein